MVTPLGSLQPASAFQGRPFSHSRRSGFQPLQCAAVAAAAPQRASSAAAYPDAQRQLRQLLELKLQALQAKRGGSHASSGAVAALLQALANSAGGANLGHLDDESKRLRLAQKLLLVRAALQARITRRQAAMSAAAAGAAHSLAGQRRCRPQAACS